MGRLFSAPGSAKADRGQASVAFIDDIKHGRKGFCSCSDHGKSGVALIFAPFEAKRGHMRRSIRVGFGFAAMILGLSSMAQAQVYGPYTFDANSWATSASVTGLCSAFPNGDCAPAVIGHSPTVCAVNIQCAPDNYIEVFFGNTTIVNNPGVDLVVFDTRFSTDAASIAVETDPGVWTMFDTWSVAEQFPFA